MTQLFVPQQIRRYGFKEGPDVESAIEVLEGDSFLHTVERSSDLAMRLDGTVGDGFVFTSASFRRICDIAQPGLYTLVDSLSASSGLFAFSVSLFNQVISAVFPAKLAGLVLLVDRRARRIDAVFRPTVPWISAMSVYRKFMAIFGRDYVHYEAVLHGRKLLLRRYIKQPIGEVDGVRVHRGVHFCFDSGHARNIKASWSLVLASGPATLVADSKQVATASSVVQLETKLQQKLEAAALADVSWSVYGPLLQAAFNASLRLTGGDEDLGRAKWLRRQLISSGMPSAASRRVLAEVVAPAGVNALSLTSLDLESRRLVDLFFAAARCGRRHGIDFAAKVAEGSFKLLTRSARF